MAYKTHTLVDAYQIITERMIAALEAGVVPWQRPWKNGADPTTPANLVSKRPYRGINVFVLWTAGYASPFWCTFNQAKSLDAKVRKGEHGWPVTFWKKWERTVDGEDGEEKQRGLLLRYYTVFNVEQLDGLDPKHLPAPPKPEKAFNPIRQAKKIVDGYEKGPVIQYGGNRASYSPSSDRVQVPQASQFSSREAYYATLFHELTHSTGHEDRLDRLESLWFGSEPYAKEELVAEMGSAFLCAHSKIGEKVFHASAAYIQGWLSKLRADPKLVIHAAAQAQKATDMILGVKPYSEEEVL